MCSNFIREQQNVEGYTFLNFVLFEMSELGLPTWLRRPSKVKLNDPELQILEKLFMAILFAFRIIDRRLLTAKRRRIYIFKFRFVRDV